MPLTSYHLTPYRYVQPSIVVLVSPALSSILVVRDARLETSGAHVVYTRRLLARGRLLRHAGDCCPAERHPLYYTVGRRYMNVAPASIMLRHPLYYISACA